jgi:predicted site-specific integrase-resolvase
LFLQISFRIFLVIARRALQRISSSSGASWNTDRRRAKGDRSTRSGLQALELAPQGHTVDAENGCEIVVANQNSLSPEQEMVEDLLAIVHTFSCRLYGMHKYTQQIKADFSNMPIHLPKDACE